MGIIVEFNPDLALRNIAEYESGNREYQECIPAELTVGQTYTFLKKGQRNYWLHGKMPLIETDGTVHSEPKASVVIQEATHFLRNGEQWTKGVYEVQEVL